MKLNLGIASRRAIGVYVEQARALLLAAVAIDGIALLDRLQKKSSPALAIVAVILNVVVSGLFVAAVVLISADAYEGRARRGPRELVAGAWAALGPLLAVGLIAGLTIALLSGASSLILTVLFASLVLSTRVGGPGLIVGLLVVPVLVLLCELFLITIWSVIAPVVVVERPGGLRALGRSHQLIRDNRWRVLALILMFALPLGLALGEIQRAASSVGSAPATAIQLFALTLIAPIPAIVATVLYFELRREEPRLASLDPTGPFEAPPNGTAPSVVSSE